MRLSRYLSGLSVFLDEKNAAPQFRGKNWLAPRLRGDPPIFSFFLKAKKLRPHGRKGKSAARFFWFFFSKKKNRKDSMDHGSR